MRKRRLQQGGVFIITVGVLASLVAILAAAAATQQVNFQAVTNRLQARRARLAAESGVQRALAVLQDQDRNVTNQTDEWFTFGQEAAENFVVGNDSFRVQILDASGFINLNSAAQDQLEKLPLTPEQIDSLLDWREAGTTPRALGGKDEYYNALPTPYNVKARRIDTIDELLLIKDFNAATVYEPPTGETVSSTTVLPPKPNGAEQTLYDLVTVDSVARNVNAQGQVKTAISAIGNPAQLIALGVPIPTATTIFNARAGLTTYRALLQLAGTPQVGRILLDNFGVSTAQTFTGKINVNTASEAVLNSVASLPPDVASAIISRQQTGFTSLGDLFDVPGFTLQVAQQTADLFTTNSDTFLIRVVARAGQTHLSLEALVTMTDNGAQILRMTELPFADMTSRWGWQTDTTAETVLKEAPTDGS